MNKPDEAEIDGISEPLPDCSEKPPEENEENEEGKESEGGGIC